MKLLHRLFGLMLLIIVAIVDLIIVPILLFPIMFVSIIIVGHNKTHEIFNTDKLVYKYMDYAFKLME